MSCRSRPAQKEVPDMFQINDYVVYGSTGICQIVDVCRMQFAGVAGREYYILEAVYGNRMRVYVPTDCEDAMRHMMTRDELLTLIRSMPDIDDEWITEDPLRRTSFQRVLRGGDQIQMIRVIKMISKRRIELEKKGKRLTVSDADSLKEAEKMLHNEFAFILQIEPDEVVPFILNENQLV